MQDNNIKELNLYLESRGSVESFDFSNRPLISLSKKELNFIASEIIRSVADGNQDAFEAFIFAKKALIVFEHIAENLKDKFTLESIGNTFGSEITTRQTGVRYDYSMCKHKGWDSINLNIKSLEVKRKEIESVLKSLKGETKEIIDEDSGEVIYSGEPIYPPARSGKESKIIKIL